MKLPLLLLIISSLAATLPLKADEAAVAAKLAKFPKPAAEALKKAAGTAAISSVSLEKEGKTTVYEARLVEAGKPAREISVAADGTLNAEEYTMPLSEAPAAVKKAIEAGAKGAEIKRVQHITRKSGVTYEAMYVAKGKETEVEFLEDGSPKPE